MTAMLVARFVLALLFVAGAAAEMILGEGSGSTGETMGRACIVSVLCTLAFLCVIVH